MEPIHKVIRQFQEDTDAKHIKAWSDNLQNEAGSFSFLPWADPPKSEAPDRTSAYIPLDEITLVNIE